MNKQKLISPALMWLITIAGIALVFFTLPKVQFWRIGKTLWWLFSPVLFYWLYLFGSAIKVHQKAAASVAQINRLVKEGIYARVRHPIYAADITLAWGIFIFMGEMRFLLAAAWLTLVMYYWMRLEERGLTEKFGQEYLDYMKEVPMICPRVR